MTRSAAMNKTHLKGNELAVYAARNEELLCKRRERPRLIDLFCGAGGLTLGFTKEFGHLFRPVWANDIRPYCAETYNANFGQHCVQADINDLMESPEFIVPQADVVIGGPPCQGFSLLNKNRKADARKQLWRPFLEVVARSGASIFLMENVPPLLRSPEYRQIEHESKKMGFNVASSILCAADYGAPQKRFRAFILGCRGAVPKDVFPPKRTHIGSDNGRSPQFNFTEYVEDPVRWHTVRDAIENLVPPIGTEIRNEPPPYDLHFGRNPTEKSMKRYRSIPDEGMNRFDLQKQAPELTPGCWIRKTKGSTDLFGRLWWDRPAFTIRTEFFKPEKGRYLHPSEHRPITHREAARFQTFPDNFKFMGTKLEIAIQIGNAVPPLLASRVADSVFALWLSTA